MFYKKSAFAVGITAIFTAGNVFCAQESSFQKITILTDRPSRKNVYGGHQAVTRSLLNGFSQMKITYNYNPPESHFGEVVIVLADIEQLKKAIRLKQAGKVKKILAGPNLVTRADEHEGIIGSDLVDLCLVPSDWVKVAYEEDVVTKVCEPQIVCGHCELAGRRASYPQARRRIAVRVGVEHVDDAALPARPGQGALIDGIAHTIAAQEADVPLLALKHNSQDVCGEARQSFVGGVFPSGDEECPAPAQGVFHQERVKVRTERGVYNRRDHEIARPQVLRKELRGEELRGGAEVGVVLRGRVAGVQPKCLGEAGLDILSREHGPTEVRHRDRLLLTRDGDPHVKIPGCSDSHGLDS